MTRRLSIFVPLINTSTVDGTATDPLTDGSGKVIRSGRIRKSDVSCTPPSRIGRPQPGVPLM